MSTYDEDLSLAMLSLSNWTRRLKLARTKCRKLGARVRRLKKHVAAGDVKKKRKPNFPLRNALPVVHGPAPIIEAGVDPTHQTDHCDDCGYVFKPGEDGTGTCSHSEYLTLCIPCYEQRGNTVR